MEKFVFSGQNFKWLHSGRFYLTNELFPFYSQRNSDTVNNNNNNNNKYKVLVNKNIVR
jgi:hypothetical protein